MLKNDVVIFKSGSKLAAASGKKDKKSSTCFANMTYIARNDSKGFVNAIVKDLDPVAKLLYPTFTAIARQAPILMQQKFLQHLFLEVRIESKFKAF